MSLADLPKIRGGRKERTGEEEGAKVYLCALR